MKNNGLLKLLVSCIIALRVVVGQDQQFFSGDGVESLYDVYRAIEDAVRRDPKQLFRINQAFFPSTNYRYWQVDGVDTIPIDVSVTIHQQPTAIQCNAKTWSTAEIKNATFWTFQWTSSLLMNHVPGDILMAMDNIITAMVYSEIVGSYRNRWLRLSLNINQSSLPCNLLTEDFEQALALFLNRVSLLLIT